MSSIWHRPILEAAGIPEPNFVHGIQQKPYEGISMAYSFDDAKAAERHETQYFEMFVNRGIFHKGWTAVTSPQRSVGLPSASCHRSTRTFGNCMRRTDWSQAHNIAEENPEMLKELQRLFMIECVKHNVLPLDDRRVERFNSDLAGRPTLIQGKSQILFSGMGRLSENVMLNLKNKSHSVTAEVVLPEEKANGVIIAQGGEFGGWSLYTKDGKLKYCYNLFGVNRLSRPSPPFAATRGAPSPHGVRLCWRRLGKGW